MKLSKTHWMIIITGILTIAIASLAIVYFQQVQQHKQLNEQLIQVQTNTEKAQITKLVLDKTELEAQLGEVEPQFEVVQGALSQPILSSTVTRTLFDIAEDHGLEIIEMTSTVPSKEKLAGVEFSLITLTTHVEGDSSNMVDFIIDLNNHFPTGIIRNVTITIPENSSGEKATVDILMVIYTRQG